MTNKVAIIGGGVIGTSVAWHVSERERHEVLLLERDRLGSGTTWHSAGNITWTPNGDRDLPIDYMLGLVERLHHETGQDTGWLRTGRLFLARSEQAMRTLERHHHAARERDIDCRLLEPEEVASYHPLASPEAITGAWYNPRSGRVNPADLVAAYAKGARMRGARIMEQCPVERIIIENGHVSGLQMMASERMDVDRVVVCTGLWSRQLLARSDFPLAHGACEHFYVIAQPSPSLSRDTPSFICPDDLIYGREEVGGFLVGFFDRDAKVLDVETLPEPFTFTLLSEDWDQIAPYYDKATEIFPALRDAPIRRFINGPESFTPDGKPLVGAVDGVEGLYVACAMNSAGVTYSGMVGHTIADLLTGTTPHFGESDYTPARFGSRSADEAWVDEQMAVAPSRFYQEHHQ